MAPSTERTSPDLVAQLEARGAWCPACECEVAAQIAEDGNCNYCRREYLSLNEVEYYLPYSLMQAVIARLKEGS